MIIAPPPPPVVHGPSCRFEVPYDENGGKEHHVVVHLVHLHDHVGE